MRTHHLAAALLTASLAVVLGSTAPAQNTAPPVPKSAAPAGLLPKAELETTGAQLRQKVDAQAASIAALREQLLAMQAQVRALDQALNASSSRRTTIPRR